MKDSWLTGLKMARNHQKRHTRPFWEDFDGKGGHENFPNFFHYIFYPNEGVLIQKNQAQPAHRAENGQKLPNQSRKQNSWHVWAIFRYTPPALFGAESWVVEIRELILGGLGTKKKFLTKCSDPIFFDQDPLVM